MAITILDQPTAVARVGQKLIVMAESTNVGQPNFRYVVKITTLVGDTSEYILPPNPANKLVFDLSAPIKSLFETGIFNGYNENTLNYTASAYTTFAYRNFSTSLSITIREGYDVGGVFTINEGSSVAVTHDDNLGSFQFLLCSYKVIDGYKPDPNIDYSFAYDAGILGSTKLLMGDRKPSTHYHDQSINRTPSNQQVFIPVRKSEADYGVLNFLCQNLADYGLNTALQPLIRMTMFNSVGAPSTATFPTYADQDYPDVGVCAIYPANLNAHGDLLRPADFPNWKYYTIALYDSTNTNRVSAEYVFYPVADDCRFDNVRLGWWSPIKGGWDFFNFSKKSEEVVEVERKRMKKVVGTYASDTFSFNPSDRETTEMVVDSTEYLNITSNWIQEGEFELLKSLVKSHSVYIINDDGTVVPVLVEDNSYTVRHDRTAKLYNQTFKLRYSQQYM